MIIRTINGTLKHKTTGKIFQPILIDFETGYISCKLINPVNGCIRDNAKLVKIHANKLDIMTLKLNNVECKTWKETKNF